MRGGLLTQIVDKITKNQKKSNTQTVCKNRNGSLNRTVVWYWRLHALTLADTEVVYY